MTLYDPAEPYTVYMGKSYLDQEELTAVAT